MNIYMVIMNDRHSETVAKPFAVGQAAIDFAKAFCLENCSHSDDYEEHDIKGWLFFATYSCEGDCAYVIMEELVN